MSKNKVTTSEWILAITMAAVLIVLVIGVVKLLFGSGNQPKANQQQKYGECVEYAKDGSYCFRQAID